MSVAVTITATGLDWTTGIYVIIGETEYTNNTSGLTVEPGDELTFSTRGKGGSVSIDGTTVLSTTAVQAQTYTWGVPPGISSISIDMSATGSSIAAVGTIVVTTEKIPEPAKTHRTLVEGVGFSVSAGRCLVSGVGYSLQKGRALIDGVGYDVPFSGGFPAADLEVGSSVYANVNGVRTEFLVVHQGLPDATLYDASCDGTWLLSKDCDYKGYWRSGGGNVYRNSYAHSYLNSTYLNSLESNVISCIKTALIPHYGGSSTGVSSGANGLSTQVFLLAGRETGLAPTKMSQDGVALAYFSGSGNTGTNRTAYYNGAKSSWWTRSAQSGLDGYVYYIGTSGAATASSSSSTTPRYRPAFILDSNARIDPNTFDILG